VRIDRSDLADGSGDAQMARRARSASDDADAAGKDKGKAVSGDGPPDSAPARPDSAQRTERTAAYRANVDAVYRQYAIDHSYAGAEKLEREMVTRGETPQATDGGDCGDVPDDPRNYSNPKTGRFDASWSTHDRAIAAAREHTGGDLGPDSIKMYDCNPETGEGTGTLIGEQTPDRLRGWRIDGQDGHVNWWDWTGQEGSRRRLRS
jgi:hypothetical protein